MLIPFKFTIQTASLASFLDTEYQITRTFRDLLGFTMAFIRSFRSMNPTMSAIFTFFTLMQPCLSYKRSVLFCPKSLPHAQRDSIARCYFVKIDLS